MIPVPVEIIWLPSVSCSFITRHIAELLGTELLIENEPLCSSEEEELHVTIFGKLKLQISELKLLVKRWCGQEVGRQQMCLSLDKDIALDSYRTLDDKWIGVDDMSFGTIVGLNKFAEHYGTNVQNMNKKLKFKVAKIKVYFQHDIKLMSVYFHVVNKNIKAKEGSAATHRPHRFEFEYSAIDKILINRATDSKSIDVYFYISHPPLTYIVELPKDADKKSYENYINQSPDTTYSRVDTFADCSHSDIGLSTVLKLQFSSQERSWNAICNFLLNSKTKYYFSPIFQLPERKSYRSPKISGSQFGCTYALQSLLSRSQEIVVQIDERQEMSAVNEKLNGYARESPKALEATLFNIFSSLDQKKIINFSRALDVLYQKHRENIRNNEDEKLSVPENMTEVRRAILTPTRIILLPPQPYFKCRFFRDFESEYTIRLSVKDDDISNLSFKLFGRPKVYSDGEAVDNHLEISNSLSEECDSNLNEENKTHSEDSCCNSALEKVRKQLLGGFRVGSRHYELLGCSSSHFREHGILFYAKDSQEKNARYAREKMGDFGENKYIPSKYMARLGQVFSQSLDYISFSKEKTRTEDDITINRPNNDKPYIFSDGIGKISPSVAQEVFKKLGIKYNPSAIQIRYAGCKGMLTQWSDVKDQIVFRESMKKFESPNEDLDILKTSKPRFVFLNRPFITILSQLGVPDEVFLNLQNNALEGLFNSLFSEEYATSILHVFSMLRIDYKRIHEAGINILQEPFLLSLLKNIFELQVVKLATKARIMISPDKGRTMFGVLDETKTLDYGHVFVQYTKNVVSEDKQAETVILDKEIVLVTKNPCMHPGDVRKFEAVDVEALRHIKDCIVFPAKGRRPHPDEMAGSDLDGDEYSVIWGKELIFCCDNYDPMDFPADKPNKLDREIEVSDMVKFFCDYISAGQVGQIATAHLVWADCDSGQGGIFSKRCKDLAHKYSIALDFAKSGTSARLSRDERPAVYPDYLDKGLHNDTYLSKNILGQLYRCSKTVLLGFEGLAYSAKYEADEDLNYPGQENYRESAEKALSIFNNEVDSILQQYGISSEGELFSGAIMKTSKYICVKQDLNDLTVIEHRINKLVKEMQKKFCDEFLSNSNVEKIPSLIPLIYGKHKEKVFQKASAWYMVTYEHSKNGKTYFGFPWTVHEILYELKKQRKKLNVLGCPNTFEKRMNEMVMENLPREENEMNDKMQITLSAFKIMNDWLISQPFIVGDSQENNEYRYLMKKMYNEITDDLDRQDSNEELSVYRVVLRYLHRLSCLTFKRAVVSRSHNSYCFQEKILGLLSFKTLLNIFYRHEFSPSSLIEADMKSSEQVFRIPLSEDSLFQCIIHKREELKQLLIEWTKVDEIELRLKPDRRNKWYMLFTVKGNKYALYHFQDIIFQNNFLTALRRIM